MSLSIRTITVCTVGMLTLSACATRGALRRGLEEERNARVSADSAQRYDIASLRSAGAVGVAGPIQNRRDALKRLSDVADFFQKTEPHSPISYIVSRAVKWGNMPLEVWLKDVIKDEAVLGSLRQTLGFNTALGDGENPQQ